MIDHGTPIARWRARMGWSQRRAAKDLGIALTTLQDHERGTHRVTGESVRTPLTLLLACSALEHGLQPID